MKHWNSHFSQFQTLNWLMVWTLMCCSAILLFPVERLGQAAANFVHPMSLYLWLGVMAAGSYFISQLLLVGWALVSDAADLMPEETVIDCTACDWMDVALAYTLEG